MGRGVEGGFKGGGSVITQVLFQSSVASLTGANRTASEGWVEVHADKRIKATVSFKNTGSKSIYGMFWFDVFYGEPLSESSGDPEQDYNTWKNEMDGFDGSISSTITLNPGDTITLVGNDPVEGSLWLEGALIDAGVVIGSLDPTTWEIYYYDSLRMPSAILILPPTS